MIADLYKQKIQSIIIEGGAQTLNFFIEAGLWDEARLFISKHTFGKGIAAPKISGRLIKKEEVMGDEVQVYVPHATR
jgi:diaminohydroxyphosphoribosylaminopyrimidine deaminase/5-amino-6-(5-phosphoribosylamino)uracil reductase